MKLLLLIAISFAAFGCAHKNYHQLCSETLEVINDEQINKCIAEKSEEKRYEISKYDELSRELILKRENTINTLLNRPY